MRSVVPWFLLLAGCASVRAVAPPSLRPSEVTELSALPIGYSAGETVRASCSSVRARAFDDEALDDVDCSLERLSRVLRARAGEQNARFIIGKRCHGREQLECSAKLALASSGVGLQRSADGSERAPAPSAAQVLDLDEPRPQDAERIRVGFAPFAAGERRPLSVRSYDAVAETHWPSVGRAQLGRISATCDACDGMALRHALRVTAGRIGAGEVTSVKCFTDNGSARCIAVALVPWSS